MSRRCVSRGGFDYDLIHAHYWLSGVVGLVLRDRWSVPLVQMFHTLGRLKNGVARASADREPAVRIEEETRIVGAVDRDRGRHRGGARAPREALRRGPRRASP